MQNIETAAEFIQKNSLDGGFLQSEAWKNFQQSVGRKTHKIIEDGFYSNIIEHALSIVGKYFYCPRGPILDVERRTSNIKRIRELINIAKEENAGWIRIEPKDEQTLKEIKNNIYIKVVKAPHDIQPKEIFVIDISKDENQLLAEMKSKTRYNIKLAEKHGVVIRQTSHVTRREDTEAFLQLTKEMALRQGITSHPENYYRKMIDSMPENMLRLYVAKYDGKIIAANLVLFFGKFATYLHGASSNSDRNVMAPYLLQWQAILDAKQYGCERYDFGGVKTVHSQQSTVHRKNDWAGITQFKLGFSPNTKPVEFPGTYDIIINPQRYAMYRGLQKAKSIIYKFKK